MAHLIHESRKDTSDMNYDKMSLLDWKETYGTTCNGTVTTGRQATGGYSIPVVLSTVYCTVLHGVPSTVQATRTGCSIIIYSDEREIYGDSFIHYRYEGIRTSCVSENKNARF